MNSLPNIITEEMAKLMGTPMASVAAAASGTSPVAVTAVGLAVTAVNLGLFHFYVNKLKEYNSTMREIHERLKLDEEAKRSRGVADEEEAPHPKGIRPVVWPTREQVSAAEERVQYDRSMFHLAVSGASGCGKSYLINALRGLTSSHEAAAKVGVTECTSKVTRYPDPRKEHPCSQFVWYDIPGAGTINVPDWQYFNDQGLFVFDFIIIAYDTRFTTIDEGIIKNCIRCKIPFFLVRSKADQHIDNMIKDRDGRCELQEAIDIYVTETRADVKKNLEKMAEAPELVEGSRQLLLNQRVYIVSGPTLRGLFQETNIEQPRRTLSQSIIDEEFLIKDMLKEAAKRRCHYPVRMAACIEEV